MKASELIESCMSEYKLHNDRFMCNLLEDYGSSTWVQVAHAISAVSFSIGNEYTLHCHLLVHDENYRKVYYGNGKNFRVSELHQARIKFYENLIVKLKSEGK